MAQRRFSAISHRKLNTREQRPHLSKDTIYLIEGFLGIEEYVGDFVRGGLGGFQHSRTHRNLHLQWGAEEMRHSVALEQVLLHTCARTQEQLDAYHAQATEGQWTHTDHGGVDGRWAGPAMGCCRSGPLT